PTSKPAPNVEHATKQHKRARANRVETGRENMASPLLPRRRTRGPGCGPPTFGKLSLRHDTGNIDADSIRSARVVLAGARDPSGADPGRSGRREGGRWNRSATTRSCT